MLNNKIIAGTGRFCSNATIMTSTTVLTTQATLPSKFMQDGNSSLESSLPKPNLVNQQCSSTEPKNSAGEQGIEIKDSTGKVSSAFIPSTKVPKSSETKKHRNGASNSAVVDQNQEGGIDHTGAKKMSTEYCNREPQRPVNPFAKSSSSKEPSSSLLDSIKKMKVDKPNSRI